MITELFGALKKENISLSNSPISPENLGQLISLISNGTISGKIAKDVFAEMMISKKSPSDIVKNKGLEQVSDDTEILKFIDKVISENEDKVKDYLISINFFFLYSGTILSHAIVKRPSFSSAPFTLTSSAIVNDLANCLCEMPL